MMMVMSLVGHQEGHLKHCTQQKQECIIVSLSVAPCGFRGPLGCIRTIEQKFKCLIMNCLGFIFVPLDVRRNGEKYYSNPS